jgi:hypothetical protein
MQYGTHKLHVPDDIEFKNSSRMGEGYELTFIAIVMSESQKVLAEAVDVIDAKTIFRLCGVSVHPRGMRAAPQLPKAWALLSTKRALIRRINSKIDLDPLPSI